MSVTAALSTHTVMRQALSGRVLSSAARVMSRDVDWFNLSQSWEATSEVADLVNAGVRQEAALAQAFQNQTYAELGVTANEPALTIDQSLRTGTTPELSYRRAGSDMRRHLNDGAPQPVALELVMQRLEEMITDDLALAMREQSRRFFMANERTTRGYRRVVRPELSTSGTCGLCLVASDRLYSRGDLLPIHSRCRCDVLPVTADYDPGDLNDVDLAALYEAAGSNQAGDLLNVRLRTEAHGELGPRIIDADNPGNAPFKSHLRNRIPEREQKFTEILSNAERDITDIEARIAAGVASDYDRAARLQEKRGEADEAREWLQNFHGGRSRLAAERRAA